MEKLELKRNPKIACAWASIFGFLALACAVTTGYVVIHRHISASTIIGIVLTGLFTYGTINMQKVTTLISVDKAGVTLYPQQRLKKHIPWKKIDYINASSWRNNRYIIVHYCNKNGHFRHAHIQTTGVGLKLDQLSEWARQAENYDPKWRSYYD